MKLGPDDADEGKKLSQRAEWNGEEKCWDERAGDGSGEGHVVELDVWHVGREGKRSDQQTNEQTVYRGRRFRTLGCE